MTSELWCNWKSQMPSNNIKIERLHYKKLLERTILYCYHGESATLCCVALTDSCTRPVCDEVSLKKLYSLPPSYFLVNNTNWSVIIWCHKSLVQQCVVLSVHLSVLVVLSIAKCAMLSHLNTHLDSQTGDCASHRALRWNISPLLMAAVTLDSEEGLQSKHQPLCCPNKYYLQVPASTKGQRLHGWDYFYYYHNTLYWVSITSLFSWILWLQEQVFKGVTLPLQ